MKRTALFFALSLMASVVVNAQSKDNPVVVISSESAEHDYGDRVVIYHEQKEVSTEKEFVFCSERQPEFPGGMAELIKYLKKNLRYPQICKEQGVQGRVIVQFVVNPDSTLSDFNVIKSVNPHLDKEALRVVSSMPKWKPGEQRGKPVSMRMTLPVTFRLPEDTVKVDTVSVNKQ